MLRTIFVLAVALVAGVNAIRGPFEALLFYIWLAYFRPENWMWDPTLMMALRLSLVAGIYLALRGFPEFFRARFDLRAGLFVAMLVLSAISAAVSPSPAGTLLDRWIEFAKTITVAYLLYALTSKDLAKFRLALLAIAFSIGLEAAKQGYGMLLLHPGGLNRNPLVQLGDNNGVAVGMLMLAPVFLALANTCTGSRAVWERRLHLFFFVGILYRAITTYSRGAFLALGVMTIVYILRSRHTFKALVGAVVVAAMLLPVLPDTFWQRMSTIVVSDEAGMDASSASRLHFWRVAIDMASARPLTGVGFNAYNHMFDEYDYSRSFYGHARSVHSMWFGILGELGYPGIVVFVTMFVLAVTGMGRVARMARRGEIPMAFYHYAVALQTAFAACMVGGSFVPWQYTEMMWHFVALSMALRVLALDTAARTATAAPTPARVSRFGLAPLSPVHARQIERARA